MISLDSGGIEDMTSFRSEICAIPRKDNPGGLIQIMSKKEMKLLKIDSPGLADSAMMSLISPMKKKKKTVVRDVPLVNNFG